MTSYKNTAQDNNRLMLCLMWATLLHGCLLLGIGLGIIETPTKDWFLEKKILSINLIRTENNPIASRHYQPLAIQSPTKIEVKHQKMVEVQQQLKTLSDNIASIQKKWEETKSLVSSNNKEASEYVAKWQAVIENLGNQHYPIEAKSNNIQGEVHLLVRIKNNGHVEKIQICQSSGYSVLDKAATKIVQLASPFEAFPETLAQKQAYLDVLRIWQFTAGQLQTKTE